MDPQLAPVLDPAGERPRLEHWVRAATTPQRVVWRSRIVLLALDGMSPVEIAAHVGVSVPTVRLWIRRFNDQGADGLLHDAPGRGRHASIDSATVLSRLREAHLIDDNGELTSLREAARFLGVSPSTVWRALHKRSPER
jgi:transposase